MSVVLAAGVSVCAASSDLEKFVRERVLPFSGLQVSSSTFASIEVDVADTACDDAWRNLKTKEAYDAYRLAMREKMYRAIGTFPARTPLNARTVATYRREGYTIEKVIFESMPNVFVTGNLFVPDGEGKRPAVVMSCGHSADGKDCNTYLRACVIAAKRGFVTFMFDPYQQGERRTATKADSTNFHTQMGLRGELVGWSAPLLRIWDGMRAIDYVLTRPEVDSGRLGYMGQSGGGTMTALMEAAEPRIRVAAPSCFLTSLRALCEKMGPQDGEQNIFGQLAFGLNHTGYVLIPDIPVAVTCKFSDMFPYAGVRTLFRTVRDLEANVGLGERAFLNGAPGPHGWTETTETSSVMFLAKHLIPECRDLEIDMDALWLLDQGFDISKVDVGLAEGERGCAPGARVTNLPGNRHIFDVIAARYQALSESAKKLDLAAKRAAAAKLAKVKLPAETGFRSKETVTRTIEGIEATRVVVQYPRTGAMMPAVVLSRAGADKGPVLIAAAEGRARGFELAQPYLENGHPVMVADITGIGEVGKEKFIFYGAQERPDEGLGAMCFLLGEPLVGRRAGDLLVLADVLAARCGGKRPLLVASGFLAVPAAHAVAADAKAFAGVELSGLHPPWTEVLAAGEAGGETYLRYADIVPRACLSYDWPELLER